MTDQIIRTNFPFTDIFLFGKIRNVDFHGSMRTCTDFFVSLFASMFGLIILGRGLSGLPIVRPFPARIEEEKAFENESYEQN